VTAIILYVTIRVVVTARCPASFTVKFSKHSLLVRASETDVNSNLFAGSSYGIQGD